MKQQPTALRTSAAWVVLVLILCQFVPLDRFNRQPATPTAIPGKVRTVLEAHCYQCHSKTTNWPKTAYIAPLSWYVTSKIHEARKALNFSDYDTLTEAKRKQLRDEVAGFIKSKELTAHGRIPGFPEIRLNNAERQRLIDWRAPLKSVMSGLSARRMERRNRNVRSVHEDFEHHPTPQSGRAISF